MLSNRFVSVLFLRTWLSRVENERNKKRRKEKFDRFVHDLIRIESDSIERGKERNGLLLMKILAFVSIPRSRAAIQIQIYIHPTWPIRAQNDSATRKICIDSVCFCCGTPRFKITDRITDQNLNLHSSFIVVLLTLYFEERWVFGGKVYRWWFKNLNIPSLLRYLKIFSHGEEIANLKLFLAKRTSIKTINVLYTLLRKAFTFCKNRWLTIIPSSLIIYRWYVAQI